MKIPKHIDKLIEKRAKIAEMLIAVTSELDEWLETNNIDCEDDCVRSGCLIYCEPYTAAESIRESILNH